MIGTAFWYVNTDQWRYDKLGADLLATPLGRGPVRGRHDDRHSRAVGPFRLDAVVPELQPATRCDIVREARAAGVEPPEYVKAATAVRRPEVRGRGSRRP